MNPKQYPSHPIPQVGSFFFKKCMNKHPPFFSLIIKKRTEIQGWSMGEHCDKHFCIGPV